MFEIRFLVKGKGFQVKRFSYGGVDCKCGDKAMHDALAKSLSADYHVAVDYIGVIGIKDPDGVKDPWAPKDVDDIRQTMSASNASDTAGEETENKPPFEDIKDASGAVLRAIIDQFEELNIQKKQTVADLRWSVVEAFYPDRLGELEG